MEKQFTQSFSLAAQPVFILVDTSTVGIGLQKSPCYYAERQYMVLRVVCGVLDVRLRLFGRFSGTIN
jgi:hypothetical protein